MYQLDSSNIFNNSLIGTQLDVWLNTSFRRRQKEHQMLAKFNDLLIIYENNLLEPQKLRALLIKHNNLYLEKRIWKEDFIPIEPLNENRFSCIWNEKRQIKETTKNKIRINLNCKKLTINQNLTCYPCNAVNKCN